MIEINSFTADQNSELAADQYSALQFRYIRHILHHMAIGWFIIFFCIPTVLKPPKIYKENSEKYKGKIRK